MNNRFEVRPGRIPAALLLCLMLGACSTTQKSATSSGEQDPAPISDATQAAPVTTATPTAPSDSAASASSGSSTTTPSQSATQPGDAEAGRLKQQLADQEAEINRLREEQLEAQRLADERAVQGRATAQEELPASAAASQPQSESAGSSAAAASGAAAATGSPGAAAGETAAGQPAAVQPLERSVYFEFDRASIPDEYDGMLVGHAAYIKAHADLDVEVQGNCDERGSREYNLALGQRRASAVKRALELAGADGDRIKATSFGSEKPVAFGQDEESYRQNRRADILY